MQRNSKRRCSKVFNCTDCYTTTFHKIMSYPNSIDISCIPCRIAWGLAWRVRAAGSACTCCRGHWRRCARGSPAAWGQGRCACPRTAAGRARWSPRTSGRSSCCWALCTGWNLCPDSNHRHGITDMESQTWDHRHGITYMEFSDRNKAPYKQNYLKAGRSKNGQKSSFKHS